MDVELSFLPPSSAIEQSQIRRALVAYEVATREHRDADRAFVQLQRRRGQAEALDADALADAIGKGEKDPGAKNVTKYERELADAQRQAAARKLVLDRARGAVVEAFAKHGDELREQVAARFEQVHGEYLAALDVLVDAHRALVGEFRLHAFCDANGAARFRPTAVYAAVAQIPIPAAQLQDDTRLPLDVVFELMRAAGAPPKRVITNPHQELVERGENPTRPFHRPLSQQGVVAPIAPVGGPATG